MIALTLLALLCSIIYYLSTRTYSHWTSKNITGPKPIPFFGNIKESVLRKKNIGIIYKEIYDKFADKKVIGLYRLTYPTLLIRDLDVVKHILVKDFEVFSDRGVNFSKEGLGDNLFHCETDVWRVLRNKFTPAFSSGKLKHAFSSVNYCADSLIDSFDAICFDEEELEVLQYFRKYSMSAIMAAAFGLNVDLYKDQYGLIEKAGENIFETRFAAEADMLFPDIWKKLNLSFYPEIVNKFCNEIVHTAKQLRTERQADDLMDIMLSLNSNRKATKIDGDKELTIKFNEDTLAGQVFIVFGAGFGNNALTLSYTLYQLAKHPDAQKKLIQEIDEVLARYGGKFTYEAMKEMSYIEKIFSEILRMNPLTSAILRSAKKDYAIPGTDIKIDKGTSIVISPYAIHRDEKLYPDPDRFDPERFNAANSKDRHPCAYIPFGAGPRSCIGRQLGKLQYTVALVKFFSKFRVEPSEKTKLLENYDPMYTLLKTKGGVHVKIIPRKG